MNEAYIRAVRLLLAVTPTVFQKPIFALKGGTAINLFVRNLPRLSVDLDLVFVDHKANRETALESISAELNSIRAQLDLAGIQSETGRNCGRQGSKTFHPAR